MLSLVMIFIEFSSICSVNHKSINPNLFYLQTEFKSENLNALKDDINKFLEKYKLEKNEIETGDQVINLMTFFKKNQSLEAEQYAEFRSIIIKDLELEDITKCCKLLNKILNKILDKKVDVQNICFYYSLYINIFNHVIEDIKNYGRFLDLSIESKVWEKMLQVIKDISYKKHESTVTSDELQMLDNIIWFGLCLVFGTENYYDILFEKRENLVKVGTRSILPTGQLIILILRCVIALNISNVRVEPIEDAISKYSELINDLEENSIKEYVSFLEKLKRDILRSKEDFDQN